MCFLCRLSRNLLLYILRLAYGIYPKKDRKMAENRIEKGGYDIINQNRRKICERKF